MDLALLGCPMPIQPGSHTPWALPQPTCKVPRNPLAPPSPSFSLHTHTTTLKHSHTTQQISNTLQTLIQGNKSKFYDRKQKKQENWEQKESEKKKNSWQEGLYLFLPSFKLSQIPPTPSHINSTHYSQASPLKLPNPFLNPIFCHKFPAENRIINDRNWNPSRKREIK